MANSLYDDALDALDDEQPAANRNPYLETLDDLDSSKHRTMRQATVKAAETSPDRAAEVRSIADYHGLTPEVVERNFDDLKRRTKVEQRPYADIERDTPKLAEWMSDPNNAAIADDDLEPLGALEWLVTAPQRAFAQSVHQMRAAKLRTQSLYRDLTQEERDLLNAEKYAAQAGGELGARGSWFRGAVTGGSAQLANLLYSAKAGGLLGGLGAATGATVGGLAAGPAGVAPGAAFGFKVGGAIGGAQFGFELEAGLAYDEFLEFHDETGKRLDPQVAKAAAFAAGAMNAGLEVVGLGILARSIPGVDKLTGAVGRNALKNVLRNPTMRAAFADAAKSYAGVLTAETGVEIAQRAITMAAGELGKFVDDESNIPQKGVGDWASELAQEGVAALQAFTFLAGPGPVMQVAHDARRIQRAQQAEAFFTALGQGVSQSKTLERAPAQLQQLLEQATKDGPVETVYAPAETFAQYWQEQGQDPAEVAAELTGDREAFDRAMRTGEDLAIPTATYAVKMAGTDHHKFFAKELRFHPDDLNAREVEEFREQQRQAREAAAEQQKLETEGAVRDQLTGTLEGAGMPRDTAEPIAGFYQSFIGSLAEREGVDPTELYRAYGLDVERSALGKQPAAEPGVPQPSDAGGTPAAAAGAQKPAPAGPVARPGATVTPADLPVLEAEARALGGTTPADYTGPERRQTAGAGPEGVERRAVTADQPIGTGAVQTDQDSRRAVLDAVAAMRAEDPDIAEKGAAMAARAREYGRPGKVDEPRSGRAARVEGADAGTVADAQAGEGPGDAATQQPEADERERVLEAGGDGAGTELRRLPASTELPAVFQQGDADSDAARLGPATQNAVRWLAEELETFPFVARTWNWLEAGEGNTGNAAGGKANIVGGTAGAEVYNDVLAFAPLPILKAGKNKGQPAKAVRATRGQVAAAARELLENPVIDTAVKEGIVRVAERRAAGDWRELSPAWLPPSAGEIVPEGLVEQLSDAIDLATDDTANLLADETVFTDDAIEQAGGDTSFDVELLDPTLAARLRPIDPKVDVLTTGEQQPRLPGDVGEVREQEIATPEIEAPFALTPESRPDAKTGAQTELFQSAYHGSPHIFDKFTLQAMGSGEGAQVYGWGLYFAQKQEVADWYREKLAGEKRPKHLALVETNEDGTTQLVDLYGAGGLMHQDLSPANRFGLQELYSRASYAPEGKAGIAYIRDMLERSVENYQRAIADERPMSGDLQVDKYRLEEARFALGAIEEFGDRLEIAPAGQPGRTYKVEIPEDDDFLSWDLPASKQSPKVQEALRDLGIEWEPLKIPTPARMLRWFDTLKAQRLAAEDIGIRETLATGKFLAQQAVLHVAGSSSHRDFESWYEKHQGLVRDGVSDPIGETIYDDLRRKWMEENRASLPTDGWALLKAAAEGASRMLVEKGLAGIRYLDGSSRQGGQGTQNYVVADDSLVQITEFYQEDQQLTPELLAAWVADVKQRYPDLVDLDVYITNAGDLELDTISVRRAAANAGKGTEVMRELTRFADAHQRRILLSPAEKGFRPGDTPKTSSKARLVKFYKRFGFVENKGRHRDFTTMKAMYREPTLAITKLATPDPGAKGDQTQTPAFRAWFGESKVVDEEGNPLRVFHGTTSNFEQFNRERANPESDFGAGIYFSSNPRDVGENYAGRGPDLEQKLQLRVERIESEYEYDADTKARVDKYIAEQGTGTSVGEAALAIAAEDYGVEHGGATMPVYLKFENPAIVGGDEGTRLTFEEKVEAFDLEDYSERVEELREDFGDDDETIRREIAIEEGLTAEGGTLVDFIQALRDVSEQYSDGNVDHVVEALLREGMDNEGVRLEDALAIIKADETFGYFTDDTGTLVSNEIVRQALERIGFDGIIDHTVDVKFGSQRRVGKAMAGMDAETVHYIAFKPEQIKSALGNRGTFDPNDPNILRQEDNVGGPTRTSPTQRAVRRGSIRFGPDRQFTISLFEEANLSTFLHESGHFFLEVFSDVADRVMALDPALLTPQQRTLLADYAQLLQWLGVDDRSKIGVEQHEKFARGFEAYLMEGNAPSLELRSTFAKFRAWLVSIYRSVTALRVNMNPEIRQVLDRMVASDRAIAEAQAAGNVQAMFLTPEQAGMDATDFALYRDTIARASRTAREELDRKLLAEVQREQTQLWKDRRAEIEAEVTASVHGRREYRALAAMQKGTNPDGSPLEGVTEPLKLSRQMIVERFGGERLKQLPKPWVYSRDGGLDPDAVAQVFGFSSGDELLTAIAEAPPARELIQQQTDVRMMEEHGSMLLDGTIVEQAQQALSSEDRELVVRAELRALGQLARKVDPFVKRERQKGKEAVAAQKQQTAAAEAETRQLRNMARRAPAAIRAGIPPANVLRAAAQERIARTRIRELRPAVFWSASRRAAQQALEAAARMDYEDAIVAKNQELLNLALYREAMKARDDVDARVKAAKALGTPAGRKNLVLAGETYTDQIDAILDRYEFARVPAKVLDRRASLRKYVAGIEGEGLPVDIPEEVLEETRRVNYQELTLEELIGVTDTLEQIVHLAGLKNRLLKNQEQRELDQLVTTLADSILEHARGTARVGSRDRRPSEERRRAIGDFFAGHRKLASLLRELDGFQDGGPAWRAIMLPLNQAADAEATQVAAATRKFAEIVEKAFPRRQKRELYTKRYVEAVGQSLSRMERIVVALNWGNETSRDRIRRGYGWTDEQVQAILDTLSSSDLVFVQDVFDFVDSFWPETEAKQKRVYGVAPQKVEASGFTAAGGSVRGGYYPLKYDDRQDARAIQNLDLEAANLARQAAYNSATTKRGHTKERAAVVKMPPRLDFGVMFEHVAQVIHDNTHHEALIDVGRILGSSKVQKAILETQGDLVYKQIRNTIRDVAFGDVPAVGGFERAINHIRVGATIAGLGWNLVTSMLQPLGLANAIVRIGPKWVAIGVGKWIRNPITMVETVRWIEEQSEFMRNRGRTQQREISEIRNSINSGGRSGVGDSYFWFIQQAQRLVDVPTWLGAYEKAMASGETEVIAIALADQAVLDSQGGGQIKDLAEVQRGTPMKKLWTNFYSYFNVVYNQAVEARKARRLSNPLEVGRLAGDYLMLFIVPATLGFMIREAMRPRGDDDETPEEFAGRLAAENLSYIAGTMLGLREVSGAIQGAYGYEGPAGARAFAALSRMGVQGRQVVAEFLETGTVDETLDEALLKSINDVAGTLLHFPAGQLQRTLTGIIAVAEGRTQNPAALVAGPPRENR